MAFEDLNDTQPPMSPQERYQLTHELHMLWEMYYHTGPWASFTDYGERNGTHDRMVERCQELMGLLGLKGG
jgi:hypothetical protein